jgi:ABC-2 type transport system permease protein
MTLLESPVYMMWLRQIKRYFRSRSRLIGSLGQPVLFLVSFGLGFGPVYQRAGGGNYLEYISPGIISMSVLFTSMFQGIEIIWDRQFGFLKETLVAPVSRLEIFVGKSLGGATTAVFQGVIVFLLSMLVGYRPESLSGLPLAVLFMFLIAFLFTGVGTSIASLLEDMHGFQLIMNFLVMPLFFLSGALYPLDGAPDFLVTIARLDPLSYGVDGIRGALSGQSVFGVNTDLMVLSGAVFFVLLLGNFLFSRIEA